MYCGSGSGPGRHRDDPAAPGGRVPGLCQHPQLPEDLHHPGDQPGGRAEPLERHGGHRQQDHLQAAEGRALGHPSGNRALLTCSLHGHCG